MAEPPRGDSVSTPPSTTQLPLQQAILIGAILSLVLYCVRASEVANLVSLQHGDDGWTALMRAAEACHRPIIERLLAAGAPSRGMKRFT